MRIVLMAQDKPGCLQIRLDTREAHLAYIAETGVVEMAGPLLNHNDEMCGSLIVLEVDDLAAAESWAENDPYHKAGLFQKVTLDKWNKVIG